jgi:paraquat-inducible protein B
LRNTGRLHAALASFKEAEVAKTSAEIAELKASNDSLQKQVAELTQLAQAAKEDADKAECKAKEDMKVMKDECEVKVAEANSKIIALESEKATAARMLQLTSVDVEVAKAEEILKTWASVSDEHFTKIVDLYAVKSKNDVPAASAGFDLDPAKATAAAVNPNNSVNEVEKAVAKEKALAEKIAAQFKFTKTQKGSK